MYSTRVRTIVRTCVVQYVHVYQMYHGGTVGIDSYHGNAACLWHREQASYHVVSYLARQRRTHSVRGRQWCAGGGVAALVRWSWRRRVRRELVLLASSVGGSVGLS